MTKGEIKATAAHSGRRLSISYGALAPLLASADIFIILVAAFLGRGLYQWAIKGPVGDLADAFSVGLLSGLAYNFSARYVGLYSIQALINGRRQYLRVIACTVFAVLLLTVILFLLKAGTHFSRGSVICFVALAIPFLVFWRMTLKDKIRRDLAAGAVKGRRALLVGHKAELSDLSRQQLLISCGVEEVGRVEVPRIGDGTPTEGDVEAVDRAIHLARDMLADEVVLCVSWGDHAHLDLLRERLRILPLPVRLLPDRFVRPILSRGESDGAVNLIDIQRAPLSRVEQIIKRAFDLVVACTALVILLPLMMTIGFALKLERRGPAIFRQRRRGFNGREFEIYKFRTMTVLEDGPAIRQAEQDDRRVTTIGRVLRRTSIDELPQLVNVLQGQMSIVGPRPHAVAHDEEYAARIGNYAYRHHMKPGITGWAQVNGLRGGTPRLEQMRRRIEEDLWYINNWSLGLDVTILARTCLEFFRPNNAY